MISDRGRVGSAGFAAVVLASALLAGCTPGPSMSLDGSDGGTAAYGSAVETLTTLEVKGRAPKTGYERDLFGQAWSDVDRNGCDTRNDILRRDSTDVLVTAGTSGCRVQSGVLQDRYSATSFAYERGDGQVEVDHVVALSDAWQKGAQQLSEERRTQLANDPLNLVATRSDLNQQKSDGDAATWLPPDRSARCDFVARQVAVKHTYDLWVTQAEQDAMRRVLDECPGQGLPTGKEAPALAGPVTESGADDSGTYYLSCAAARESGAAPLYRGADGYRSGLDGDGDGVACE